MIVFLIYATIAFGFEIGLLKNNLYKITIDILRRK